MMEKLFPDLKRESMQAAMEDCDGNGGEEEDDAFYEEIEAPKFVDFTVSDDHRYRLDDPSWFCVRVGCDQMHEMVDPEALHKSFVLRVMAARSPNVKLRKVLYKQSTSSTPKCPKSAPPKPANDRVVKFSRITSVHEKTCIAKIREHPISSLRSTPKKLDTNKTKPPTTPKVRQTPKKQKSQVLASKTTESSAAKNTPKFRICSSSKCATFDARSCKQERTPLSVKKKKKIEEISKNVSVVTNVPLEYIEEDDDKENAPDNRNMSNMNLEKQQTQKEKSCKKMKPTNPKPFRLRTDERGILKEANLERKLQNSAKKNITPMITKQGDEIQLEKQQKMVKLATPTSKMSAKKNTNMKGKKQTTIPKEPNFQRIHLPKGCTKRQEQPVK
ncbi:hypothetical protein IHE45_08G019500 [Dioscorea alata]|uniref:Uncharacterized protein n=1 Tax=Dioscorea alata TaxID=55571 RepID=A0ACB7VHU6_DIOAL|nr:hypothetical protein IHE45_08G019500 [Dioscorea alata]